jgi:hypothetical protein
MADKQMVYIVMHGGQEGWAESVHATYDGAAKEVEADSVHAARTRRHAFVPVSARSDYSDGRTVTHCTGYLCDISIHAMNLRP